MTDLHPEHEQAFSYEIAPAPPKEPEASTEDREESLAVVAIQFHGLDHLVVVVFDPAAAEEARASYPGAALWSAEAFKRFLDDAHGLSDLARRQLLVSANLVKSVLGGSYQGLTVGDPPRRRKR